MAIQHISVFVENKQGKLVETVKTLADHDINIRAMSIADTNPRGIEQRHSCELHRRYSRKNG